jgi:hypothetical protein
LLGAADIRGVKMSARFRTVALVATCAIVALGALAPAASARRVARKSATAVLPSVFPSGRLRAGERVVSVSTHAGPDAQIEVVLQAFCLDNNLRFHRRQRTFTGTGAVHGQVRRPRGRFQDCTASASVRVTSRPLSPSGQTPGPTRLGAALYARA